MHVIWGQGSEDGVDEDEEERQKLAVSPSACKRRKLKHNNVKEVEGLEAPPKGGWAWIQRLKQVMDTDYVTLKEALAERAALRLQTACTGSGAAAIALKAPSCGAVTSVRREAKREHSGTLRYLVL